MSFQYQNPIWQKIYVPPEPQSANAEILIGDGEPVFGVESYGLLYQQGLVGDRISGGMLASNAWLFVLIDFAVGATGLPNPGLLLQFNADSSQTLNGPVGLPAGYSQIEIFRANETSKTFQLSNFVDIGPVAPQYFLENEHVWTSDDIGATVAVNFS